MKRMCLFLVLVLTSLMFVAVPTYADDEYDQVIFYQKQTLGKSMWVKIKDGVMINHEEGSGWGWVSDHQLGVPWKLLVAVEYTADNNDDGFIRMIYRNESNNKIAWWKVSSSDYTLVTNANNEMEQGVSWDWVLDDAIGSASLFHTYAFNNEELCLFFHSGSSGYSSYMKIGRDGYMQDYGVINPEQNIPYSRPVAVIQRTEN